MKKVIAITLFAFLCAFPAPARAGKNFQLVLQVFYSEGYYQGIYYRPGSNVIRIREDDPVRPWKLVLKNITATSQRLNVDLASAGLYLIAFEVTDDRGNKNLITKKISAMDSKASRYEYIGPGRTKEFVIILTEREWNNAYKLEKQGASKLRLRASYKNGNEVIYSDDYTILLEKAPPVPLPEP
ncbi:MAG: hypothetical protein WCU74_00650 [Candidatus Omnitrophota bacterium]